MELNRDFSEFITCFTAHDVRFLIVDGYAVAAHGHLRYTKDLDVWVRIDAENARRIVELATGRLRDLADLEDLGLAGPELNVHGP